MKKEQVTEILDRFAEDDYSPLIPKELNVDMTEFTTLLMAYRNCKGEVLDARQCQRAKVLYTYLYKEKGFTDSQLKKLFGIQTLKIKRKGPEPKRLRVTHMVADFCTGDTGESVAKKHGINQEDYEAILKAYRANEHVKYMHSNKRMPTLYAWLIEYEGFTISDISKIFGITENTIQVKLNSRYANRIITEIPKKRKKGRICSSGAVFNSKSEFWRKK